MDVDFEKGTVRITPEKGSNPRTLKLSNKLLSMLNRLPRRSAYIYNTGLLEHFAQNYRHQRKSVAWKLNNPRINQITFKTLRHFKATMEYHKTRDILHVMHLLGHKRIENTLVYTHLVDFQSDEYVSQIAKNADEACKLVEAGFEFVCTTPENLMLFRKRK
ncbi:site-specific integrase [Candidatus Bathyarchaeota archaeon]|nr:site-specific integrase [Candidatus Bathyarchaeota archaeon]MBS7630882.1 site-specific integrase [Candidatus Bathyarchaeota archaeon]